MSYKCLKCGFDNTPGAVTMSYRCLKCGFDNTPPGAGALPPQPPIDQQPPPPTNPKPPPTNPQPPGETFTVFETQCLNAHNMYRARHGVPKLKLNKNLCKFSKEWASHLVGLGRLEHRKNLKYGENIALSYTPNVDGKEAVDRFYNEIKYYAFGREPSNLQAGHFTQVVWKSSTELGVGYAKNTKGHTYVVCNYNPPGNFSGRYRDNVPPKK